MTGSSARRLRHEPGLDGLRGFAVLLVVIMHTGASWAPGGWIGVSLFFTLSGYLITTLLMNGPATSRGLGRFWGARFRRLMPALLVTIVGVLALALAVDFGPSLGSIRSDAAASLLYVANWRLLESGQSYEALIAAPTPLLHIWSLAIEEQFYVVFPLVVVGARRLGAGRRGMVAILGAGWVAGAIVNVALGASGNLDAVYYATPSRIPELLSGAVLGLALPGLLDHDRKTQTSGSRLWAITGALGLATTLLVFFTTSASDDALLDGLLPLLAVSNAALLLGVLTVGSYARMFSWRPLVALGLISYGIYLFHWPIFLALTEDRVGFGGPGLVIIRVVVTLAVAMASYRFVEQPIRHQTLFATGPARLRAVGVVTVALLVVTVLPASSRAPTLADLEAELAELQTVAVPEASITESSAPPPEDDVSDPDPAAATEPQGPLLIQVFGDSTAFFTALGLARWATAHPDLLALAPGSTEIGCPLGRGGRRDFQTGEEAPREECDWTERWPALVAQHGADVIVVQAGPWETADFRMTVDDEWTDITAPQHQEYFRGELAALSDALASSGGSVIYLTNPLVEVGRQKPQRRPSEVRASDPARMGAFNALLIEHAATRADVFVIDMAGYLDGLSGGVFNAELMPDGMHFTGETAEMLADDWLAAELTETGWAAVALGEGSVAG